MEEEKKAYDLKVLGAALKAKGLIQAEEVAEDIIKETFIWLKDSAVISKTTVDDMLSLLYPQAEALALGQADKISDHDNA